MSNIKTNYIYNILYQILLIILPLITAPYLSRVIGVKGAGIYSYTYSIVYYFMLFSMLGINNYGNREIAKNRDDRQKVSKIFYEIHFIQKAVTILMVIIYIISIIFLNYEYKNIAFIQIIFIISVLFDINWFFQGIENFKFIVLRNAIIKIVTFIVIFIFVKTKNDLCVYTFIMAISTLLSQFIGWLELKKHIDYTKIRIKEIQKHLKPILTLFIPVIAVSIYQVMDKIMLGSINNIENVGLYEYSQKIISIPLSIITAFGTVTMPRMSNLLSNGINEQAKKYIKESLYFQLFISLLFSICMILISEIFIPFYLGEEFYECIILTKCLAIMLPFVAWQTVIRTQFLIPLNMDKHYINCTICGAIINFIINLLLIPIYGALGACIGTVIAEISVMIYINFAVKKFLDLRDYFKYVLPLICKILILFLIAIIVGMINFNEIVIFIIQFIIVVIGYIVLNFKYIKQYINLKSLLRKER